MCRFSVHAHTHTVNIYVMSELRSVEVIYNSCYTHTHFFFGVPFTIIIIEWEQMKAEKKGGREIEKKERCKRQCFNAFNVQCTVMAFLNLTTPDVDKAR